MQLHQFCFQLLKPLLDLQHQLLPLSSRIGHLSEADSAGCADLLLRVRSAVKTRHLCLCSRCLSCLLPGILGLQQRAQAQSWSASTGSAARASLRHVQLLAAESTHVQPERQTPHLRLLLVSFHGGSGALQHEPDSCRYILTEDHVNNACLLPPQSGGQVLN